MSDHLIIFDTTMRDGEQSPGASMSKDDKLRIARQLERMRVDVIEAGFAAAVYQRLVQHLNADPGPLPQDELGAIGLRAVVEQVQNDIRVREFNAHARLRGSGVPQRAACGREKGKAAASPLYF